MISYGLSMMQKIIRFGGGAEPPSGLTGYGYTYGQNYGGPE